MIYVKRSWIRENQQKIANVFCLLIIAYMVYKCDDKNTQLAEAKKSYKIKMDNAKERINSLVENTVLLNDSIDAKNKTVRDLLAKNKQIQKEKESLRTVFENKIAIAKKLNPTEVAAFFSERYKLPNDVRQVDKAIQLSDTVSKLAVVDLIGGDKAVAELELTQKELYNFQGLVDVKDKIIGLQEKKEVNLYGIISQKDTIIGAKDGLLLVTEQERKKEKRDKNIWKTAAIAIATAAGYLLITK